MQGEWAKGPMGSGKGGSGMGSFCARWQAGRGGGRGYSQISTNPQAQAWQASLPDSSWCDTPEPPPKHPPCLSSRGCSPISCARRAWLNHTGIEGPLKSGAILHQRLLLQTAELRRTRGVLNCFFCEGAKDRHDRTRSRFLKTSKPPGFFFLFLFKNMCLGTHCVVISARASGDRGDLEIAAVV